MDREDQKWKQEDKKLWIAQEKDEYSWTRVIAMEMGKHGESPDKY